MYMIDEMSFKLQTTQPLFNLAVMRILHGGIFMRKGVNKVAKKMGRPEKKIDQKLFENLCSIMCTEEEIAGIFECSIDTINNWCKKTYGCTFSDIYKNKSSKGKTSLRRWQFKAAEGGNVSMMIWLGKNLLGQRDQVEATIPDTSININVSAATADDVNNE